MTLWDNIQTPNKPPKLLDKMRNEIRRRHDSPNTEKTYICWVKQYIYFHDKQPPKDLSSHTLLFSGHRYLRFR